jgi:polyisoprenoid-binding protein YceI
LLKLLQFLLTKRTKLLTNEIEYFKPNPFAQPHSKIPNSKGKKKLGNYLVLRFVFYFLVFLFSFYKPSISEEFQLPQNTDVKFQYFVTGLPFEGDFKVIESKFNINFRNPIKSIFSVKFDLMQSNAGFPLATRAMKQVLDAYKFPEVMFKSNSVELTDKKFNVTGFLKIRNVTKPVNLIVTVLDNYSLDSEKIRFSIRTRFNRRQFGADGYYPLVRDAIIIEDVLTLNKLQ